MKREYTIKIKYLIFSMKNYVHKSQSPVKGGFYVYSIKILEYIRQ